MVRRINESRKNKKSVREARIGRTKEVKVLQGNWGYGWDDLCEYDKYDNGECRADLRSYLENDPSARYRVIFRRVPNKDYVPTESVRKNRKSNARAIGESLYTDNEYELAKEVADALADTDYADYLDNGESFEDIVDEVADRLFDDPYDVLVDLSEVGADSSLINSVAESCATTFGVYAREFDTAIPVILKFPSQGLANNAYTRLREIEFDDELGETASDIMRDCEYQGTIEVHGIEFERKCIGNAYESSNHTLIYVVNPDDRVDIH